MGLTVAIGNALAGLKANQASLEVISRNISNAGTPGYHRQNLNVIEVGRGDNSYVRTGKVDRAFDQILQNYYTKQLPETAYASTRATFLDRLQTELGKPGAGNSLDTMLGNLSSSLDTLATSPDNYAARADVITKATDMAGTLNRLSNSIQDMRRETETRMSSAVNDINAKLVSLRDINFALADFGLDQGTRISLLDQRDRLVSNLSEQMDMRVDYNPDGTVRLATKSGTSLLDVKASLITFEQAGSLVPTSEFNVDSSQSNVGKLILEAPNGTRIDLVREGAIKTGQLGALIELRDTTLQDAQAQLDDIAAAMAQLFSTVQTPGTKSMAADGVTPNGFDLDLANVQNGNDFVFKYTDSTGVSRSVKVVRTDDASKLPLKTPDADGMQVIGIDFAGGGTPGTINLNHIANEITKSVPGGPTFASGGGSTLQLRDNNNAKAASASARWTAKDLQGGAGQLGLQLFVDSGDVPFTDSLSGQGQRLGFAARITVNSELLKDNKLLVNYDPATASGDSKRADYLVNQFKTMRFGSNTTVGSANGGFRLSGTITDMVGQTVQYQSANINTALTQADTQAGSLEALTSRMEETYGVDINEEVSRLMELQNAYAANARLVSVVQELLDALMQSF